MDANNREEVQKCWCQTCCYLSASCIEMSSGDDHCNLYQPYTVTVCVCGDGGVLVFLYVLKYFDVLSSKCKSNEHLCFSFVVLGSQT